MDYITEIIIIALQFHPCAYVGIIISGKGKTMRPKYSTGHDLNHFLIRDFMRDICGGFHMGRKASDTVYLANFRGYPIAAIDTSRLGGFWLDWLVIVGGYSCMVEVKTPDAYALDGHSLKPDEQWTVDNLPIETAIISTDEQVAELFNTLLQRAKKW